MAVYRINPEKDTTIWSEPTITGLYGNAGKDEIIELGGYPDINLIGRSKRILTQFNNKDIQSTLNSKVTGDFSASLHMYLANASEIPTSYSIYSYFVSQSWSNGTGKIDDVPVNKTGASWRYRGAQTNPWDSLGGDYITEKSGSLSGSLFNISGSQNFQINSDHDINLDVTDQIKLFYSESVDNYGLLLKLEDRFENNTTQSISLKYFGVDSNTIFPPYLEFKWDDFTYSSSLSELTTDIATLSIKNAKEKYTDSDTVKFRISARPKYPTRTFTTSSIYLTEYRLPQTSYWGIRDEYSNEMIVDFDTTYTKISADNTSSFFLVYMNSFQPNRYYRLLVKTVIDDNTVIVDNRNVFKVVKNG